MSSPPTLHASVRAVQRRARIARALDGLAAFGVAGLGLAALVLAAAKAGALDDATARAWLAVAAAIPLVGGLIGGLRAVPALLAAQLLDRSHELSDRVASALEFEAVAPSARTAFMRAAIADAERRLPELSPARAMPLRAPRDLAACMGLAAAVLLLGLLEARQHVIVRRAPTRELAPLLLHPDDLDAYAQGLDRLATDPGSSVQVREAARDINQLLEDLADRRLDRTEALRRVRELESHMLEGRSAAADAMRDAMRELGEELARSRMTKNASDALRDADAARAARELRALADAVRHDPPNRAELDRLRQALERAGSHQLSQPEQDDLEQRRQEVQRLLQRQREQQQRGAEQERDRRLLERRQRELERMERAEQDRQQSERDLDRLQRDMQQSGNDLRDNRPNDAANGMDRSAEDLHRMSQQQLSQEQMQQLPQRLEELREQLQRQRAQQRQQAQGGQAGGGQSQGERMERFVLRARGQGESGERGMPLTTPGNQGQGGQAGEGQGEQQGGSEGGTERGLVLGGEGGGELQIPGGGNRPGQGGMGQGTREPGPGAGTGHDATTLANPTALGATRQNVRVEGEAQHGPSRSEVILGAADRGFVSEDYERVYVDYERHAEEVLEQDQVPGGYRFYVRRYFQLIRPREERR